MHVGKSRPHGTILGGIRARVDSQTSSQRQSARQQSISRPLGVVRGLRGGFKEIRDVFGGYEDSEEGEGARRKRRKSTRGRVEGRSNSKLDELVRGYPDEPRKDQMYFGAKQNLEETSSDSHEKRLERLRHPVPKFSESPTDDEGEKDVWTPSMLLNEVRGYTPKSLDSSDREFEGPEDLPSFLPLRDVDEDQETSGIRHVFIWDLDSVLAILGPLSNRYFGERAAGHVKTLDTRVTRFSYRYLHYKDVSPTQLVSVSDVISLHTGVSRGIDQLRLWLTKRYVKIISFYSKRRGERLKGRLDKSVSEQSEEGQEEFWNLWETVDRATGGWLTATQEALTEIQSAPTAASVVMSRQGHLVSTIGKILIFNLQSYFPINRVYAACSHFKSEDTLRHIVSKFGGNASIIAIGNSSSFEEAAHAAGVPYLPIGSTKAVRELVEDIKATV